MIVGAVVVARYLALAFLEQHVRLQRVLGEVADVQVEPARITCRDVCDTRPVR